MNFNDQKMVIFPAGHIMWFANKLFKKPDWLEICDGKNFDINQFPELFINLGCDRLPDLNQNFLIHKDNDNFTEQDGFNLLREKIKKMDWTEFIELWDLKKNNHFEQFVFQGIKYLEKLKQDYDNDSKIRYDPNYLEIKAYNAVAYIVTRSVTINEYLKGKKLLWSPKT